MLLTQYFMNSLVVLPAATISWSEIIYWYRRILEKKNRFDLAPPHRPKYKSEKPTEMHKGSCDSEARK